MDQLKNAADNSEHGVWSLTASGRLMLDAPADQLIKMVRKANSNRRKATPRRERAGRE
jgi:hypothetical protein